MTELQQRLRRPAAERGFTLIELLVVIIILGILAAVVVFAVNGVGDKGKSAATTIDERTIQTAEEAYCAKNGEYASGQDLVTGGFLSELPEYHQVNAQPNQGGPCNGWKYFILRTAQADPYPAGSWAAAPTQPTLLGSTQYLVRMPDGKVLAGGGNLDSTAPALQLWDPVTDVWSSFTDTPPTWENPTPVVPQSHRSVVIVLKDDPSTPQSECKGVVDNCGKIFAHGRYLFSPNAPPGAQWQVVGGPSTPCNVCNGATNFNYVQPMNKVGPCGAGCGKVFIFGQYLTTPSLGYDVFDPKDNSYTTLPYPNNTVQTQAVGGVSTQLSDGRVLILSAQGAIFFDPASSTFTSDPVPVGQDAWVSKLNPPPVLPNGDIFFSADSTTPRTAGVYTRQPGGPGTLRQVDGCVPGGSTAPLQCLALGSLLDGRVMAIRSTSFTSASSNHQIYLYNPATEKWTQNPNRLNNRFSYGADGLLLDPAGGPCGAHCGKMMVAGSGSPAVELYTP